MGWIGVTPHINRTVAVLLICGAAEKTLKGADRSWAICCHTIRIFPEPDTRSIRENGNGLNLYNESLRLSHVEQIVHDSNPMGHSNAFGRVGIDQRLGNTMNARERFDLIGRPFGTTGTATAVPDPLASPL